MKRFINRESVTLIVLSMVVMVVICAATVAWFMGATPVSVKNINLSMDDKGDLYVWVRVEEDVKDEDVLPILARIHTRGNYSSAGNVGSAGNISSAGNVSSIGNSDATDNVNSSGNLLQDVGSSGELNKAGYYNLPTDEELQKQHFVALSKVGTGDSVNYTIDFNIVAQDNIEEQTFAPGAYGKVEFKILSMTYLTTGYTIKITPSYKISDRYDEDTAQLSKSELSELVASHIKFYAVNDSGNYSEVIPYYDEETENCYLKGDLEEGVMEDVILYWYWPYEYVDIPDKDNADSPVYSEYEKYRNLSSVAAQIEAYDWDDTYIGNYVEELTFHFDVEGNR